MQPDKRNKRRKWRNEAPEFTKEYNQQIWEHKKKAKARKNKKRRKRYKGET